jgi:hypothetical protein
MCNCQRRSRGGMMLERSKVVIMARKEYLASQILFSWDSDEETIDSMPKLVDRAGNIREWDSDSASDSDIDINDDENSDVTEDEVFDLSDAKSSEVTIVVVAPLNRY